MINFVLKCVSFDMQATSPQMYKRRALKASHHHIMPDVLCTRPFQEVPHSPDLLLKDVAAAHDFI